jgi:hypothetical protein
MYVPFEDLPEDSRIWIYQSNRKFSDAEFSEIETALQSFLEGWAAHGTSLESSYQLNTIALLSWLLIKTFKLQQDVLSILL